jgi:8-oxo-dGTP pyrophosphatase MutT (NUDIX family)
MKTKTLIVVANLLENKRKFLLVKERKRTFNKQKISGKWNLPAGRLENESLIDCLVRETREESGFKIKPNYLVGIFQYPKVLGSNVIIFVFNSKILGGRFKPSKEIEEIGWFSLKEIKELKKKRQLRGDYILDAIKNYLEKRKVSIKLLKVLK